MKIPKEIKDKLKKRVQLAQDLMAVCAEIDGWLEEQGADFQDFDLKDSVLTGCMIYTEPDAARQIVEDYIKEKL